MGRTDITISTGRLSSVYDVDTKARGRRDDVIAPRARA